MARTFCYAISVWVMLHLASAENPLSFNIGNNHAIIARAISVPVGKTLQLTCDGSRVGNPSLWWYDNDDVYVAYKGPSNRIHIAEPSGGSRYNNNHFLKLVIRDVRRDDAGVYTCRGWFGLRHRYFSKSIRLTVVEPKTSSRPATKQPTSTALYTTLKTTPSYKTTTTTSTTATTTTTPGYTTPETTTTTFNPYETTISGNTDCLDDEVVCGDGVTCGKPCDGFPDCYDNSDEISCPSSCPEGKIFCGDGSGCVERSACTSTA